MAKMGFSGEKNICRNLVILGYFQEKIKNFQNLSPGPYGGEVVVREAQIQPREYDILEIHPV